MKIILRLLIVLLFGLAFCVDYDSKIKEKKQELEGIYDEISKQRVMINETDRKAKLVADEIASIENLLTQQNLLLVKVEGQQKAIEKEVVWLEKELGTDKNRFDQVLAELNNKYFFYYKLSNTDFIEQLVEHSSLTDQVNISYMLEFLISMDVNFLGDIKKKSDNLKYKGYRLEAQMDILTERQEAINSLKKNISSNNNKKKSLYNQLLAQKLAYEKKAQRLLEDSKKIEELVVNLQKQSKLVAQIGDGKYIWPVLGHITSLFGDRMHPILKVRTFHTGLDIGAPSGRPVFAVDDGVVLYSGRWGNYGNVVILDHGDNTTTLYAHLSKYLVKNNVKVKKGNVLGLVGSTGLATGPHLHFEVRKSGKVQDPLRFLPKR
ncbi:MAG: peptidoglycan DD-metalloendopeptidase family protein [Candidatus Margulisbacteria bacterium]|nr:peptidoglycan DD-metalloendopeptidase family protein [Candidatus Margulisiibacteriota bacterium]